MNGFNLTDGFMDYLVPFHLPLLYLNVGECEMVTFSC